jgi:hypothetical protein
MSITEHAAATQATSRGLLAAGAEMLAKLALAVVGLVLGLIGGLIIGAITGLVRLSC